MTDEEADACALWVLHTWAIDAAYFTPYLSITSATSESGKSTLLRVLEHVVCRPWRTGRVTAAVLMRRIHETSPTLLLDETDAAFGKSRTHYAEALRGVLNEGFARGGTWSQVSGQTLCDFDVFGPKALAGIGKLPDTVASRSIYIRLRRIGKGQMVAELNPWRLVEETASIRWAADCWAGAHVMALRAADVALPASLSSRSRDVWRPLITIADAAGDVWAGRARQAALALAERKKSTSGADETRVLAVIREAFEREGAERLTTLSLAKELVAAGLLEPRRAESEQKAGYAVRDALRPFEVGPARKMRFGIKTANGYQRSHFEDAWHRYL
jgi:hypothetical protein